MKPIPSEAGPYVLATAIMVVLFIAGMIRLWLLRRVEERLLKNKDALEKQVVNQQKDIMQVRSDANAWRTEMQRQFDQFRHMASDQLKVEETRFDNLLSKSRQREQDLQATLDIARQMCAELPAAKARVMQLESAFGLDSGEGFTSSSAAPVNGAPSVITPMPDLNGSASEPDTAPDAAAPEAAITEPAADVTDHEVGELRQQNALLQQALTAERLRSRLRDRNSSNSAKAKARRN